MFKNIGGKIKLLAKIICIVGIALSCLIGLARITIADRYMLLTGIAIAPIGSVISYLVSVFIYGFGELIETNREILKTLSPEEKRNYWTGKDKEQD